MHLAVTTELVCRSVVRGVWRRWKRVSRFHRRSAPREFADPQCFRSHPLTIDAYCLQRLAPQMISANLSSQVKGAEVTPPERTAS